MSWDNSSQGKVRRWNKLFEVDKSKPGFPEGFLNAEWLSNKMSVN